MTITTYGELRTAYMALIALTREGLKIPLAAALKWKRIRGVMEPLVQQFDEIQAELVREHQKLDADGKPVAGDQPGSVRIADPAAYNAAITEALESPLTVGCDLVTPADFGDPAGLVSSTLADYLMALGPFFRDDAPDQGADDASA